MHAEFVADGVKRIERDHRVIRARAHRHCKRVHNHVAAVDAVAFRRFQNLLRNRHTLRSRSRDALFVERQGNHRSTVLFHKRQYRVQRFLFAVHGVHKRLAVINTQRTLHGLHVRGIDLQRRVRHALQVDDGLFHHRGLVKLRQTHVHVQNVRAVFRLRNALTAQIFQIAFAQSLL